MKPLESKLPTVGTTIFTVMSQLAEQHRRRQLVAGLPGFPAARGLARAGRGSAARPLSPIRADAGLGRAAQCDRREARGVVRRDGGSRAAEITVTSGATEAIFGAIQAVVRRDDEVIVFDPCYDSYEPSITLAGGRAIHVPLTLPDFAIDWERFAAALGAADAARNRQFAAQPERRAAHGRRLRAVRRAAAARTTATS